MRRETQATLFVPTSADAVFATVSDHEGTPSWVPKVKEVVITTPGKPDRNGLGAVRRVAFRPVGWGVIDERVTAYDAGARTFSYTITGGMPGVRDHLGTFTVEPKGEGCVVTWAVWFEFNPWLWAPFAGVFVRTFTGAMDEGLATLAAQAKG